MSEITPTPAPPVDHAAENAALKLKLADLEAKLKPAAPPADDPDLLMKAKLQKEKDDKGITDSKALESAIKFNLKADEFVKTNQSLLPKNAADIFKAADKENYSSAIEKDAAIKSGLIQSFFEVQSNLDLLTGSQKIQLDEYLKLTKTGKQERAQAMYDNIFEPTFEMLKRVKKAEALNKGFGGGTGFDDEYKNKLINGSKKHYLGDKQ